MGAQDDQAPKPERPRTGPRGGITTISPRGVRKNLWISFEENEALRRLAFDTRRTETEIMREGLRIVLGMEGRGKE